ncbi:mitochondrial transcription rescue factor 1 isoform X2 [Clupea harengus]|nr:mitochondrial transcription rescue factor 1 isoform X2 [Clupea harengus]
MQSLLPALTLRQLGRLNSIQLLSTGHGPAWSSWCPRTLHARQLWGSVGPMTLRTQALPTVRDSPSGWSVHQARYKTTKKKGSQRTVQEEEEEEEDDSDYEDELQDDPGLPKDYKDTEKYVQSLRYDLILKAGLDMARNKVEDAFYGSRLRLNGLKLIKKSKAVKVGDTLDFILGEDKDMDTVNLKRVIFKKVIGETKDTEKYKVILRTWKSLHLPKKDVYRE